MVQYLARYVSVYKAKKKAAFAGPPSTDAMQ